MSDRRNAPIGVFDSGVGGLTVAREIMRNLPEEILYILVTQHVFPMEVNQKIRYCAIPDRSYVFYVHRM